MWSSGSGAMAGLEVLTVLMGVCAVCVNNDEDGGRSSSENEQESSGESGRVVACWSPRQAADSLVAVCNYHCHSHSMVSARSIAASADTEQGSFAAPGLAHYCMHARRQSAAAAGPPREARKGGALEPSKCMPGWTTLLISLQLPGSRMSGTLTSVQGTQEPARAPALV